MENVAFAIMVLFVLIALYVAILALVRTIQKIRFLSKDNQESISQVLEDTVRTYPGIKDEDIITSHPIYIREDGVRLEPEDEHIHTDEEDVVDKFRRVVREGHTNEEEWTKLAQEFRDEGKVWLYGKFSEYNKLSGINVPDILKNEVVGFLDWLKNNKSS